MTHPPPAVGQPASGAPSDKDRLTRLLADFGVSEAASQFLPHALRADSYVVLCGGDGGVRGSEDVLCIFRFDQAGRFLTVELLD